MLLLERDLLDQQIIDVHGRKVVRVNDVDIHEESSNGHIVLKVGAVDVGARGAVRRLLKGVVPAAALHALLQKIPPRMIPVGVCRPHRDRSCPPRQAEDFARPSGQAASRRHCRHRRRPCSSRARSRLRNAGRGSCRRDAGRNRSQAAGFDSQLAGFRPRRRHCRGDGSRCRRRPAGRHASR